MDNVSHDAKNINLTSAEVGALWNTYMLESMVHHMSWYFLKHIEDPDVKGMIQDWLNWTYDALGRLESLFKQEGLAVPRGITSEDINPNAPRLFTDKYIIYFGEYLTRFGLNSYTLAYSQCSRLDIREFMKKHFVEKLIFADQKALEISLAKGTHARPPYVPTPKKVDFVQRQSFFEGFFGEKRPLTVLEITHLFTNAHTNAVGRATLIGYSQAAKSMEVKEHFLRGRDLASKFFKDFVNILIDENAAIPRGLTGEALDSTEPPFSDRLMLFHDTLLASAGLGSYGMAIAMSPRSDLASLYGKIAVESASYAKEGTALMIKNGWMEQPPTAPDRDTLAKGGK